jgi:hypothetical protein
MSSLLWKPLLAATLAQDADLRALPYPVWASPKIDGFRAMVQRGRLVSRKGLPVPNVELQARFGRPELEGLDGELCDGPAWGVDVFNRTSKVVHKATATGGIAFRVIDHHSLPGDLEARYADIRRLAPRWGVIPIRQIRITGPDQLVLFEERTLARGYEGVMLRRCGQGLYPQKAGKENRSTLREFDLVKLKRFDDSFAVITTVHQLRHNLTNGLTPGGRRSTRKDGIVVDDALVGSVTLRDRKWVFDVSVATKELRAKGPGWWRNQIGKRVRYRYQNVGSKDAPRFPTAAFEELA